MPDDIVTSIQKMQKDTVTFTAEELLKIYETARSTELTALQAAARSLYPDRKDDRGEPPLSVWEGGGRAFPYGPHGDYRRPVCTITSPLCRMLGIMEDGTPHFY